MIASLSPRFPDIRTRDLKAIHRLTGQLMEAGDLATLGRGLIDGAAAVLPADFMLWNLWTPQMDAILGFEANHGHYREELGNTAPRLNATIHHHPVVAAGKMELSYLKPQRMSNYQTSGAFKSNPLFQEVYRHVESNYQIAYVAAQLPMRRSCSAGISGSATSPTAMSNCCICWEGRWPCSAAASRNAATCGPRGQP